MSVPRAGGSDVLGNASGRAQSEAGRRYDMATRYMFPNGLRLRGRDLARKERIQVSDTGKTAEKGVSRREMTGKERMRVSDTGKTAKKGVSRARGRGCEFVRFFIKIKQNSR